MNPAFLDSMSWEMAEVYGSITDRILINLARHFPYYKPGQPVPASAFEYQARMLAQMGQVSAETMRIIKRGLDGVDKALQNTLEQAIIDAVSKSEPELIDAVKRGIFKPAGIPVVAPNQMRAFDLYYKQAADKLNLVNTVMLESTKSAYQQAISDVVSDIELADRINATYTALDAAAGETITGVSTWNNALKHATDRMKDSGITGFIDHAGHRWSAEAYAAMDIRTTVFNTGRAAVWETNENFGNDLYSVSYHNGARPLCYPYQNKVVSSTDNARTVTDLDGNEIVVIAQSATSYGKPAGLFGINCKHYPNPFIPGVSIIRGEPQDEKTNARVYEESQQQRALERKIREEKRDLLMLKEQGAPDDIIKAQRAKIRKTDDDIDAFCEQTGRARRQNREGVYTKREFPASDTYDVATFVDQQKAIIDSYYKNGGAQQNYTFGQMTRNEQISPQDTPTISDALTTPVNKEEPQQGAFVPAKTREEAEAYANRFANNVDYSGISMENANSINETLTELTSKYPTNKLEYIAQKPQGSVARANYEQLEINGKKLGKVLNDEQDVFNQIQEQTREEIRQIKERYAGKAKLPWGMQNKVDKLEQKLKYSRYGVHSSYENHVKGVVTHEYGHIIADQYFGMSNKEIANPHYGTNYSLRGMYKRWQYAYDKAIKTGDIYTLSEYGSKNPKEFFAESFAARELGETLPDYVETLLDEVLKNGIM